MPIKTISEATSEDFSYKEDWRLYYDERRKIIRLLLQFAVAAAIVLALFGMVSDATQVSHPTTMNVLGIIGALLLLGAVSQWFRFMWKLGGWICPRCREPFFISTFVRNPFGRFCRHCNLRKLASVEISGDVQDR